MPELPEVQTVVTTLRPLVVGRTIVGVVLHRRDILCPADVDLPAELVGRSVSDITRRGKRIVFTLDNASRFYIHLGMTGRLTVGPEPAEPPQPHTHLEMTLAAPPPRNRATRTPRIRMRFRDPRRFGGIWWLGQSAADDDDPRMGPEPLTLRTPSLAKRLSRTRRAIKSALLDQSLIAGLGNIYVDESLFWARIHPLTPSNQLSPEQIQRLNRGIKTTLQRAIRHRGSTLRDYRDAQGNAGAFQRLHKVYDRAGHPCPNCRTPIERFVIGGRSTHFCPKCQAR